MPPEPAVNTAQPTPETAPAPAPARDSKAAARSVLKLPPRTAKAPAEPAPAAPVAETVEAIEDKGGAVPEQKAGESDKSYELRLSETLRNLRKAEGELVTHRKRGDDLEREWAPVRDLIAATKGDPSRIPDLLELAGYTPDQVAQFMIDGKVKRKAPKAELPPEVQERIATLEAAAKKLADKEAEEESAAARGRDMAAIKQGMESIAAEIPVLVALPGALDRVYTNLRAQFDRTGETPNLMEGLRSANKAILSDARALVGSKEVVKALCEDPATRATFVEALGLTPSAEPSKSQPGKRPEGQPQVSEGPKSLSLNVTSEVPVRSDRPLTKAEREARSKAAARGVLGLK